MMTSYHVHSNLSDGSDSISAIVDAALTFGLDEIGISDHYVLLPSSRTVSWSMPLEHLSDYVKTIQSEAERMQGKRLVVRCGIEADFIPATCQDLNDRLSGYPFDYVIGSVHYIEDFPIDADADHWNALSQDERNDNIREYWHRVSLMAASGVFDIAAHLDLYKKFGHTATIDISEDIVTALDAIAASGMAIELSSAGWHKPANEAYPSSMILSGCKRRGIPVVITADAHSKSDLMRDYPRSISLLKSVGYSDTVTYARRTPKIGKL